MGKDNNTLNYNDALAGKLKNRRFVEFDEDKAFYGQIAKALAVRYEVIYYVNVTTGEYEEYSSSEKYTQLKFDTRGTDFFGDTQRNLKHNIFSEDFSMMVDAMQKENFLRDLNEKSPYSITYRLMIDEKPEYVNLRAVYSEKDNEHVIIGVTNINDSMKKKLEMETMLNFARKDALTGLKNKAAYLADEEKLNEQLRNSITIQEFAIVVCNINDLNDVNDDRGHRMGDEYIKDAAKIICDTYKHSPVYRVGGDEFALILTGEDYIYRNVLLETIKNISKSNRTKDFVTLACGMGVYSCALDENAHTVYERADNAMYEHKKLFKADIDD